MAPNLVLLVQLTLISQFGKVTSLNVINMTAENSSLSKLTSAPSSSPSSTTIATTVLPLLSTGKLWTQVKSYKNTSEINIQQKSESPEVRENCPYCAGSACSDCIPGYIWDPKTLGKVFVAFVLGTIGFLALFFFYRKWSFVDLPIEDGRNYNFGDSSSWMMETLTSVLRSIEEFNY